jgi:hypothetical protein
VLVTDWGVADGHGLSLLQLPALGGHPLAVDSTHDRSLACRTGASLRRARQVACIGSAHRADNSLAPASATILRMRRLWMEDSRAPRTRLLVRAAGRIAINVADAEIQWPHRQPDYD